MEKGQNSTLRDIMQYGGVVKFNFKILPIYIGDCNVCQVLFHDLMAAVDI